ncbi:MAG: hypothetical protein AB9922_02340 [Bacteroidales bacterium]
MLLFSGKAFSFGRYFIISAFILFLFGCASLSRGQLAAVKSFTASCDSLERYPGAFFDELAQIRAARGLYFSASLGDAQNRVGELNSIYDGLVKDQHLAGKANLSWEILSSYQRALKILAGAARWEDASREFRTMGRKLDSLVYRYNRSDFTKNLLPTGIGKTAGRVAGITAMVFIKRAQSRAVKKFVVQGDALVSGVVFELVQALKNPQVTLLIENEREGLDINYISYLRKTGTHANSLQDDKYFLSLKERTEKLTYIRGGIISSANRLAKAHNKLAAEFTKRKKVSELFTELLEFEKEVSALNKDFKNIIIPK